MTEIERDENGRIVAYCVESCGQRATHQRLTEHTKGEDQIPVLEAVCSDHAGQTDHEKGTLT